MLLPGGAEVLPQVVVLVKLAVVADRDNSRSVAAAAACGRERAIELSPNQRASARSVLFWAVEGWKLVEVEEDFLC